MRIKKLLSLPWHFLLVAKGVRISDKIIIIQCSTQRAPDSSHPYFSTSAAPSTTTARNHIPLQSIFINRIINFPRNAALCSFATLYTLHLLAFPHIQCGRVGENRYLSYASDWAKTCCTFSNCCTL